MDWPDSPDAPPLGDGRRAVALDRPDSVDSLREFVARRACEGLAIYPQGGRTALDYGGIPARPGVALDITALDAVIDYPAADMTVTIGAGMTLAKLQAVLATEGQFLPLDVPDPDRATLGGIYATNTSGPRRFGWGRPRDHVIGISFATADGKLVKGGGRVVKNVAGYDFPKLLTGSMGTLGVITQMTLKVRPKPGASVLVVVPFDDDSSIGAAISRLNLSATRPVAIEAVNESGYALVEPEAGLGLGTPRWTLIVGFEDNAPSVEWQVERLLSELGRGRADCAILSGAEASPLWTTLSQFDAFTQFGPLTFRAAFPRSKAFPFALSLDDSNYAAKVQVGSGIVVAHASSDIPHAVFDGELDRFRSQASQSGGSSILSRCPTEWKGRLNVWGERRGDWTVMRKIKAALDPASVLNPGRFVGTI